MSLCLAATSKGAASWRLLVLCFCAVVLAAGVEVAR
jgi:hypothetical protein